MQPKTPKLLEDVRDAAAFIREVTAGRSLEHYRRERLPRQAIERNFEIIGEAMNRLALHDPGTAARIAKHRRIVDFRNVLAHGYDLIDRRIVWSTIDEEVPVARSVLRRNARFPDDPGELREIRLVLRVDLLLRAANKLQAHG